MWVFVRTSTNFAHLTSFQAIEFMDWPGRKTLDISLCRTSENKAFKTQHSVTVVCPLFDDLISSPVSPFSAWSTLHYERHNNVRRNESLSSENPLGMTNIEHTPMKGKWCSFLIWCLQSGVISSLNLYLSIRVC